MKDSQIQAAVTQDFSDHLHISFWSYVRRTFITKFGKEKREAQANNIPWEFYLDFSRSPKDVKSDAKSEGGSLTNLGEKQNQ